MVRSLLAAIAALWAFAAPPALAQDTKVTVSAAVEPATAKPGDEVTLKVTLKIDDGWHVYGRDEEIGEAPRLTLTATGGLETVGETRVPVGKKHDTAGITSWWVVGAAVLEQKLKVPAGAAGPVELKGRVDFMVCDESTCLPPESAPFAATLTVAGGAPQDAGPAVAEPTDEQKVTFAARFEPATVAPGGTAELVVDLRILDGWHVYGSRETTGIPVSVRLGDGAEIEAVGTALAPEGERHETFGIESFWVKDTARLRLKVRVPADAAAGPRAVPFVLDSMACNDEMCDPPEQRTGTVTLTVAAGAPQDAGPVIPEPTEDQKVTFGARFEPARVAAGGTAELVVDLRILEGWHVYGSRETTGIPVSVRLDDGAQIEAVGTALAPEGERHDSFGLESFWVKDTARLRLRVRVPADAAAGPRTVPFVLDSMACNDEMCDPPEQRTGTATLVVTEGAPAGPQDVVGVPTAEQRQPQEPQQQDPQEPFDLDPLGLGTATPTFRARIEPDTARPGEVVDVIVSVSVPDGWHVYGAQDEHPITLSATDAEGFEPRGGNRVPDGTRHETGDLVNYWLGGSFELRQAYAVPEDAEPGARQLGFAIDYLLCDENNCKPLPPHPIGLGLAIEAGPVREEFDGSALGIDGASTPKGGWWALILAAIGAGLFALLMPCTYPMIPITISVFTKQAEARGGKVLPVSLVYGAGIVSIFILIGIVVGPAIVPFATHWLTNAVIAAVFILFAFSLFGWITLEPPRFLMNMAGRAQTHGGYVGVLLMGAALVITSFTCTVPFVASLLAIASQGGMPQIVVGMGVFGLTMAIPFVALSLVPGRMRGIPRAGGWMNTLKVFLGFVELAAAMKFVSNVDLVINDGPQWLSRSTFLWSWAAIMGVAALYLLRGFFDPAQQAGLKRAAGVTASLAIAGWCAYGAVGHDLDPVMTAIAPPKSTAETGAEHEIVKDDYDAALAKAEAADKLVLVNFTGFT